MRTVCDWCGKEVEVMLSQAPETVKVKDEEITLQIKSCKCSCCGAELWISEVENENLRNAYNEYRRRHKLLLPEQIKEIREGYGMSQVSFAKLLGFGEKTIARYENGSIQDEAHNNLMLLMADKHNFRRLFERNEQSFPSFEQFKVKKALNAKECVAMPYRIRVDTYGVSIASAVDEEYDESIGGIS